MANNSNMHKVDVFGLFNALYSKGSAKLSDHFIDDPDEEENSINDK